MLFKFFSQSSDVVAYKNVLYLFLYIGSWHMTFGIYFPIS